MKDCKSVITDKKYADISIKSNRLCVCVLMLTLLTAFCCHIIFEEKIEKPLKSSNSGICTQWFYV